VVGLLLLPLGVPVVVVLVLLLLLPAVVLVVDGSFVVENRHRRDEVLPIRPAHCCQGKEDFDDPIVHITPRARFPNISLSLSNSLSGRHVPFQRM